MRDALERTSEVLGNGVRLLAIAGGVVLMFLMLLTVADVTLRKFLEPIEGAQDISESGLIVVVFLSIAYSGWTGGHIAVDLIGGAVKGRALDMLDVVVRTFCGMFFVVVAWQRIDQGLDALEFGDGVNVLPLPHYPFYFIIAFGSLVFAGVLMVLAWRSARGFPEIKRP